MKLSSKQIKALSDKGLISPRNTLSISGILKKLNGNKYHAVKVSNSEGKVVADSKAERLYQTNYLYILEQLRHISDVVKWPTIHLTKYIKWKLDFSFTENATGETIYVDVKGGQATQDGRFRTLCQLWKTHGPGELRIANYDYKSKMWSHKHISVLKKDNGNAN